MRLAARSGQHGGVCPRPSVTQPGTRMHAESAPPSTKNEKETMVPGTSRVSAAPAPCDAGPGLRRGTRTDAWRRDPSCAIAGEWSDRGARRGDLETRLRRRAALRAPRTTSSVPSRTALRHSLRRPLLRPLRAPGSPPAPGRQKTRPPWKRPLAHTRHLAWAGGTRPGAAPASLAHTRFSKVCT